MAHTKAERNLTEGRLLPKILLFALPLMATSILQLLFNTADTVVVGQWAGERSLAAVGSCGSLITLLVNTFLGLSIGAGVCVAHDLGAGHAEEVKKTVHTSVVLSLIAGSAVTAIGLIFAPTILGWMGTDKEVLNEAALYMRAYFCGIPASMLYNYCAAILRSKGDTVRPLIFLSVGGVANVIFNLISVICFGWGAMGVGAATAISQWISCILIVWYMMHTNDVCHLELRALRIDRAKLRRILVIGIPAGIQSSFFSIANVLIQSSVNSLGYVIVAGNTAASNLDAYIYAIQRSFYDAVLTFVAQNAGARKYDRMKKSILCCSLLVCVIGISVGAIVFLFARPLLGIYAPNNALVVEAGVCRLAVMCATYFLCGLMEIGSGIMRGLGKSFISMIISLFGSCVLRIIWIYTVFAYFPVPAHITDSFDASLFRLLILYLSYPITWIITAAMQFIIGAFQLRKFKKSLQTEEKNA